MDKLKELWNKFNDTSDVTATMDKSDIENNKVVSVLAYILILFLVPIFAAKNSKFSRFHANQGLILFICLIITSILGFIPIIKIITWIIDIVLFVLMIIGIINVCNGQAKELPLIGKIRILK